MDNTMKATGAEGQTGSVAPEPRSFEKTGAPDADAYRTDTFSRNDAEGATALGEDQAEELLDQPLHRDGASSVEATPDAEQRKDGPA